MISLRYKFLFVHFPKTGGNSIQNVLHHYSEDRIVNEPEQDVLNRFGVHHVRYRAARP